MERYQHHYASQWFILLVVAASVAQASAQLHSATTSWSPSSSSSQPNQRLRDFSVTRKLLDSAQHPQRDVVTVVRSREDLAAALDNQAAHIEIQAHMNLSDWYWNGKYSDWSVLEVPGTVRSITGNCTEEPQSSQMLSIGSLQPALGPRKQGQCIILFGDAPLPGGRQVDLHFVKDPNAPALWMHNLMLRKLGSTLQYTFVRADRSFYMTGMALVGNGQVGPQALRVLGGVQALVADTVIEDWVEENSSIVVTESPLSLQACTFKNNTAGAGEALVESWFGAVVRLERVEFKGQSEEAPLLNDDPTFTSEPGVFYAPAGGALPVNTTSDGKRSTRPLSEAPDDFLGPQDRDFIALQQDVKQYERQTPEGAPMYAPAATPTANTATTVSGSLSKSAIAGIVLTGVLLTVAAILAIYCSCARKGSSCCTGVKRSNSIQAFHNVKVSRGGYSGSSRPHVVSSQIHSGNNSTVSSVQPKLTYVAEHATAPDYFPTPKIAASQSSSQPLHVPAEKQRPPMCTLNSTHNSDPLDGPTGSSSSPIKPAIDVAQPQQIELHRQLPVENSSPELSSELEPLPSPPYVEHSTDGGAPPSPHAPSGPPSKHVMHAKHADHIMSDIDEDVSPRLPMPPGHACGKLHMHAHDAKHQSAARKGGIPLEHALESVITEIVIGQKNNSALVNSRSTQSDAEQPVGVGCPSLERFYSAGSDERSPSSPTTTSGSDRTGAAVTVASAVAAATPQRHASGSPSPSPRTAQEGRGHMHAAHASQPLATLPRSREPAARTRSSLQRLHWQSVQRVQHAQNIPHAGNGNRNTPSPSRDGETSPSDSPFEGGGGYRGLHPPAAHKAAPHAGTQHFEGNYMGVPDTPSASSVAESVQSAPPASSPIRHADRDARMHAGDARGAQVHVQPDEPRRLPQNQRGRDRQPRQSSPHGLRPFSPPSQPLQQQELYNGAPPYIYAERHHDRRRVSSPGAQRYLTSQHPVAADPRAESSSSAALPLMHTRPRQSSPGAPAYLHAQDRRSSSPSTQRYMHEQQFESPYPYPGHRQPPQAVRQALPPALAPGEYFAAGPQRPPQTPQQYGHPFAHHTPPQVFAAAPPPWMQPVVQRPAIFLGPRQGSTPTPLMHAPLPTPRAAMVGPQPPLHHMRRYSVPVQFMHPPVPARRPAMRPALVATQRGAPVATPTPAAAAATAASRPLPPTAPVATPGANKPKPPAGVSSSVGAHAGAQSEGKESTISDLANARGVPMPAPSIDAPLDAFKSHLHRQLDSLVGKQVLGSLKVLGGPKNRIEGEAFQQEKELYSDSRHALGRMLPQLHSIVDASESGLKDGYGSPLPPCIIMEKGEALDVWVHRYRDHIDLVKGLQVLSHVAERLRFLHKSGYVHRDLKPANVMWLSIQKRWTIIDFGCAVATGSTAPPGFSVHYAAPEALRAQIGGDQDFIASEALDCWSLGVLALELFAGMPVFETLQPKEQTISMILGERLAPWEDPETAPEILRPLGSFKKVVLGLLKRNPLQRTTVNSFQHACHRMHARLSSRPVT